MPNGEDRELWNAFNQHKQDYERRHSEVQSRLSALEARAAGWASREDVVRMEVVVARFEEIVRRFELSTDAMATKTDVDWLKRAFWVAAGALTTLMSGVLALLIQHIAFVPKP